MNLLPSPECLSIFEVPALCRWARKVFTSLPDPMCGGEEDRLNLLPSPECLSIFEVPALCRWARKVFTSLPDPLCVSLFVGAPALCGEAEDPPIPLPRPIHISGASALCRWAGIGLPFPEHPVLFLIVVWFTFDGTPALCSRVVGHICPTPVSLYRFVCFGCV